MLEKRRLKRRHLIYYLKVLDAPTEKLMGYLVDITTEGIMVMSEEPMQAQKVYHFKMLLQTTLNNKEFLEFDVRCRWCCKSVNSDFYDSGFELLDVDPQDFEDIEATIEALGFRD